MLASVSLVSPLAHAQSRDSAATAEALFRAGRDDMNAGNYAVACPRFEESYALDPAPGTLLNLALCFEKAGKTASAWQKWQQAIDVLGEGDRRYDEARSHRDALEPQLAKVVFSLAPGFPAEATISRDGASIGRSSIGLALPVDPGRREVVVKYRGGEKKLTVEAVAGKVTPFELSAPDAVEPDAAAPAPASAPPADVVYESSAQTTVGWFLVGGGAVGLAFFGVTGAMILSDDATAKDNCASTCNDVGQSAVDRGDALLVPNAIGLVAGVALAGAGVTLILLDPGEPTETALSVGPGRLSLRTQF